MSPLPLFPHSLYVPTPFISPLPLCPHSLYVPTPFMSPLTLCPHSLYVPTPFMSPFPLCPHSLYVPTPFMSPLPLCPHSLYVPTLSMFSTLSLPLPRIDLIHVYRYLVSICLYLSFSNLLSICGRQTDQHKKTRPCPASRLH